MSPRQPVGIDLGTTYSAIATLDANGRSVMLRNAEGDVLTPSVVLVDADEMVVGKFAKRAVATQADRVAECVKRDMGQPLYSRPVAGQQLPPEVLQACILKKLRGDAGPAIGQAGVVITVPAYFDEPRRKATADAAELAGLDLLDIVNEPTAAALAFGEQLGYLTAGGEVAEPVTVLVYDLGGGTFDVTVIKLAQGDIRTLATDGDVQLGGRDWDQRLADHVAKEFQRIAAVDLHGDAVAWNQLMIQAEQAKHTLTTRDRAVVHVEHSGRTSEVTITREEFQQLTEDLVERTAFTTRQVLQAAGLSFDQLNRILLVGGSTRMPMVAAMLKQLSGHTPDLSLNPDEAVARGAALYAGYLLARADKNGPKPAFRVTDVNSHSLGIQGIDQATGAKENVIVIPRNTPLPAIATERFATQTSGQRSIVVQVLEGESSQPHLCTRIGRSVLRDLPANLPQAWPVEIVFEYATNGRLSVKANVPGTDRSLVIDLERERGLDQQRLHRWKQILQGNNGGQTDIDQLLAEALQLTGAVNPAPFAMPPTTSAAATMPATVGPPINPVNPAPFVGMAAAAKPATLQLDPVGPNPAVLIAAASPAAESPAVSLSNAAGPAETQTWPGPGASDSLADRSTLTGQEKNAQSPAASETSFTLSSPLPAPMPLSAKPASAARPESSWQAPAAGKPATFNIAEAAVESPEMARRRRRIRTVLNITGHVVASTLGLLIGYIILCKVRPEVDLLHLFGK
ncbi:MAG: Hsp70 family protein [Planctomycetia bacterium]|nr:Hsp70 family protein [Planctomycetia bacterium]